ncbi:MAG: hypothetical protein B7Z66_01170 [Chromatiales bacterium 21-64-14]|nr:MAG: hypothetical protein B7Z66_01170 [Chromatiales bacterium 21-64-14]HQU16017.1 hypothetical protein [Gammaproteobacteria bacterium]
MSSTIDLDAQALSDDTLNAFMDDQLDPEERGEVFDAMNRHRSVTERICELSRLRAMVQHAYRDPAKPKHLQAATRRSHPLVRGVAAGFLVVLGGLLGWALHTTPHAVSGDQAFLGRLANGNGAFMASRVGQKSLAGTGMHRILLHIASSDPRRMQLALNDVQELMNLYPRNRLQVEVVTNAGGVNLLRADMSPFKAQVEELMRKYPNLSFLACRNTIDRLTRMRGAPVHLIPDTRVGPTAVQEIVSRLQEGWIYIKV